MEKEDGVHGPVLSPVGGFEDNAAFAFPSPPPSPHSGPASGSGRLEIRGVAPLADAAAFPASQPFPGCALDLPSPHVFSQSVSCPLVEASDAAEAAEAIPPPLPTPTAVPVNGDVFMLWLPPHEETEAQLVSDLERKAEHFLEAAIELERRFPRFPKEMSVACMKLRASETMQRFRGRWDWKRSRVIRQIPFFVASAFLTEAWDNKMS